MVNLVDHFLVLSELAADRLLDFYAVKGKQLHREAENLVKDLQHFYLFVTEWCRWRVRRGTGIALMSLFGVIAAFDAYLHREVVQHHVLAIHVHVSCCVFDIDEVAFSIFVGIVGGPTAWAGLELFHPTAALQETSLPLLQKLVRVHTTSLRGKELKRPALDDLLKE